MKEIFAESQKIEKLKKDQMLASMADAEKRQGILASQQALVIEAKKQAAKEKQEYQFRISL